jgi:thiamine kinase-like enzyme
MIHQSLDAELPAVRLGAIMAALKEKCSALRALRDEPVATRLGGLSNWNYRINTERGSFVLRVPNPDPGPFVNRTQEIEAAKLASELGIGSELVYAEPHGIMLTRWIDAPPMSAERLRSDPGSIRRLGEVLGRLHRSSYCLSRPFDAFQIMDGYSEAYRLMKKGEPPWSARLGAVLQMARKNLLKSSAPLVPSHGDLVPANCLDDGSRMFLVDWEYAGMNDPAWDLAYFALEAELTTAQQQALVESHDDLSVSPGRLRIFSLLVAVLNYLWALSRPTALKPPAEPTWLERQITTAELIAHDPRVNHWLANL